MRSASLSGGAASRLSRASVIVWPVMAATLTFGYVRASWTVVAGAAFGVLCFLGTRWPALTATAAWSLLPVAASLVPGVSLVSLLAVLTLPTIISLVRRRSGLEELKTLIAAATVLYVSLAVAAGLTRTLDGRELAVLAAILLVALGLGVCMLAAPDPRHLVVGLSAGPVVISVFEVVRVLQGGAVHAAEVVFGMNPVVAAQVAGLGAVVLSLAWVEAAETPIRWALGCAAGMCVAGVVATGSRGPLLACAIASVVLLAGRWREARGSIVVLSVAGLLLWFAVAYPRSPAHTLLHLIDRDSTARILAWDAAWSAFLNEPLTGMGSDKYAVNGASIELPSFPHNIVLEVAAEYGLLALIVFAGLVVGLLRSGPYASRTLVAYGLAAYAVSGGISSSLPLAVILVLAHVWRFQPVWPPPNAGLVAGDGPCASPATRPFRGPTRMSYAGDGGWQGR